MNPLPTAQGISSNSNIMPHERGSLSSRLCSYHGLISTNTPSLSPQKRRNTGSPSIFGTVVSARAPPPIGRNRAVTYGGFGKKVQPSKLSTGISSREPNITITETLPPNTPPTILKPLSILVPESSINTMSISLSRLASLQNLSVMYTQISTQARKHSGISVSVPIPKVSSGSGSSPRSTPTNPFPTVISPSSTSVAVPQKPISL